MFAAGELRDEPVGWLPVRLPDSRGEAAAVCGVQSDRVVRLQRP